MTMVAKIILSRSDTQGSSRLAQLLVVTILCEALVLAAYLWFFTLGTWNHWPAREDYYQQLATSFRHGELSLPMPPDPALVALPNPYDPASRTGIPYLPNMSLYQGRYYMYFGPVPALLLFLLGLFFPVHVFDETLTILFLSGIFILLSMFAARVWSAYFSEVPAWSIAPAILALGLAFPCSWLLYSPGLTNTAIAAGQFFYLAGLAIWLLSPALARPRPGMLSAIGLLWAFAIGSRLTQIVPVAFVSALLVLSSIRSAPRVARWRAGLSSVLALAAPVGLTGLALALYNRSRFGSIFQTGLYYQLTGQDLQSNYRVLFSPVYILQDLYNYFLTLPKLSMRFPWLAPSHGAVHSVVGFITLPGIYYSQELVGLLLVSPFILLAVVPLITLVRRAPGVDVPTRPLRDVSVVFAGSFIFGLAPLLFFFWTAARYLLDFLPSLLLLAVLGFGQAVQMLKAQPLVRALVLLLVAGLVAYSVLAANLVALAVNSDHIKAVNPLLWRQLGNLFRP